MNKKHKHNQEVVYCKVCHKNKLTDYEKYYLGGKCDICADKEFYLFSSIKLNKLGYL